MSRHCYYCGTDPDDVKKLVKALERIIDLDTHVSDGGKVHDHGSYASIAIEALAVVGNVPKP